MIVKTPGSQMGSPVAAEEGGEEVGGGRWESGVIDIYSDIYTSASISARMKGVGSVFSSA